MKQTVVSTLWIGQAWRNLTFNHILLVAMWIMQERKGSIIHIRRDGGLKYGCSSTNIRCVLDTFLHRNTICHHNECIFSRNMRILKWFEFFILLSNWKNRGVTDQNHDKIWRTIFVKSRGFFFFLLFCTF